jgi:hypothetical protein
MRFGSGRNSLIQSRNFSPLFIVAGMLYLHGKRIPAEFTDLDV